MEGAAVQEEQARLETVVKRDKRGDGGEWSKMAGHLWRRVKIIRLI